MRSRDTEHIIHRLSTTHDLATKTMSFLTDSDYKALTATSRHFGVPNLKYRHIYADKIGSYSTICNSYQKMRSELRYAYKDLEYVVSFAQSTHESEGVVTYRKPGTNPWTLVALIPASYSVIKSSFYGGKCLLRGTLYTVGFFVGGVRDIARTCTQPKLVSVSLTKPSKAIRLQSEITTKTTAP